MKLMDKRNISPTKKMQYCLTLFEYFSYKYLCFAFYGFDQLQWQIDWLKWRIDWLTLWNNWFAWQINWLVAVYLNWQPVVL